MALAVLALTVLTAATAFARDPKPTKITRVTPAAKTVRVGAKFELKVKTTPIDAEDDYLKWTIVGKSGIIRFEDSDRTGDEMEFVALKTGTTKVRCSIRGKSTKYSKTFTIKVKKNAGMASSATKLTRVGQKTRTVEVGDDIDLKVKVTGKLQKKYLKWTIKNTDILRYDDGRYGKEVEVKGKKVGTTTVTCKNLKTKKTITYTVNVIPEQPDDDDDD